MSSCPQREQYQRLLDGRLDEKQEHELDTHVKSCPNCLQTLEEMTALSSRALRDSGMLPLPPFAPERTDKLSGTFATTLVLKRLRDAGRTDHLQGTGAYSDPTEDHFPNVAGYRVLGILGRGGMGVVYKAEQIDLQRIVALKMIRSGLIADGSSQARFRTEILAVARLQHPNIVQIFEIGVADGRPYYSLEYVAGGSLADKLAGLPQQPLPAAELVELVARAAHFAHEHGIVHRDLKPGNILLSAQGAPKIADFGLAKVVDADNAAGTNTAAHLIQGTPCYMAPEQAVPQASGMPVGPAADIYALGAILYEMLTGHPPFRSKSPFETALQAVHSEPIAPRRYRREVPRDLETICLKCLAKDPARRYASALKLAEDLARFCSDEPIQARPVSGVERAWRLARRHPAVTVLLTALVVVVIAGMTLVTWSWRSEVDSANLARSEKLHANQARDEAEQARNDAEQARNDAERLAARSFADLALVQGDHGNIDGALHMFVRSLALAVKSEDTALEYGVRLNLALWRGQLKRKRAEFPHRDWVWTVAYSPDGKVCATASRDKTARLWDTFTGAPLCDPLPHAHPVWALAFSRDGKELLTGSGNGKTGDVLRWQVPSGKPLPLSLPEEVRQHHVFKLAFSADGETLLIGSAPQAYVYRNGNARILTHPGGAIAAALSPDGQFVITGGVDGTARLWHATTGKPIGSPLDHNPADGLPTGQVCSLEALAFSPDSKRVLTGSRVYEPAKINEPAEKKREIGGMVRLWRTDTGQPVGDFWPHPGPVKTVMFSPDGQRALTSAIVPKPANAPNSQDDRGEVRLWDVRTHGAIGPVMKHDRPVWAAAFSPDGRTFLTGSRGGVVQFWQAATGTPLGPSRSRLGNVTAVAFSPDGRTALTARAYDMAQASLWEAPRSFVDLVPNVTVPKVVKMIWAPDGKTLATVSDRGNKCLLWRQDGDSTSPLVLQHDLEILAVAFRPDGRMIATGGSDKVVRLWDPATGKPIGQLPQKQDVTAIAFSPDGQRLLAGTANLFVYDFETVLWDVARSEPVGQLLKHPQPVTSLAFHPDGKSFLVGSDRSVVVQCNTTTVKLLGTSLRHQGGVMDAAYNRQGTTIATASLDRTAMLWDISSGIPLCSPMQHQGDVWKVDFRADGKLLLTACRDGSARLWDATTGLRIGPQFSHVAPVMAAFCPHSNKVATLADDDGLLRLWDIPEPATGSLQEITDWVQAITGKELTDKGVLRDLDEPLLQKLRARLVPRKTGSVE